MARGGMIFKKSSNFGKKKFHFILLHFIFIGYYCSLNIKKQSEHSGLRPDTSSLVFPTFDTKVTEYLCSGGFFFLQTNFDFLTSHF